MRSDILFSLLRFGTLLSVLSVLSACAPQRIRDFSAEQLRDGKYEEAILEMEQGLRDYPDNTLLRSGLLSAKADALSRLIAQATRERSEGRLSDAQATLKRAQKIDSTSTRISTMLFDLENDQRADAYAQEAQKLLSKGSLADAQKWASQGLQYAPRNPALTQLKRQIDNKTQASAVSRSLTLQDQTKPVTVDFRMAPLSAVLDALQRSSGVQFILDRDVRAENPVTVHMRNARLTDILDVILPAQQLSRKVVDPKTVLLYANTPEKQREHQEQVVRAFYLTHVEAKTTAAMLKSVLKLKEPFVDERANLVVLRESPDTILLAERLVALQDIAEPEVMLEVEVLEIKTTRLKELGIQFPSTFSLTPLSASGSASGLTVNGLRNINSSQVGVSVASLVFNLRREVGDFNTLANPRLRARNKEKAKIMIGDKVPVITTTSSTTGLVSENVSYLDVGLKFDVEPTVFPDDEVLIKLGLEVSSIVSQLRSAGGSTAYQIGTRNATTALRLKDGETQILGGLINRADRSTANRIPGLGDLPIAGRLFGSQLDDFQESELVLAITPRIIRSAPHPTPADSELWIGSENYTRLKQPFISQNGIDAPTPALNATAVAVRQNSSSDPSLPAVKNGSTIVSWSKPGVAKVGDVIGMTVQLQTEAHMRGAPMEISYPAQLLRVLAVSEGEFFKQDGATSSFVHSVNTETGKINIGLLSQAEGGVNGQGSLVNVQFKALGTGDAELSFSSLRLLGGTGEYVKPSAKIQIR
jgi:general secretion pathway protein D